MTLSNRETAERFGRGIAGNGGNMHSTDDGLAYSYSTVVARHVLGAALVTTRHYSVTTASHVSSYRSTLHYEGVRVFLVDNVLAETPEQHEANVEDYFQRIRELDRRASRAHKYGSSYTREADELRAECDAYRDLFMPPPPPVDLADEDLPEPVINPILDDSPLPVIPRDTLPVKEPARAERADDDEPDPISGTGFTWPARTERALWCAPCPHLLPMACPRAADPTCTDCVEAV